MLLHINSELRPDAGQVMKVIEILKKYHCLSYYLRLKYIFEKFKIPFFDDVAVKTLEYLDSSFQQDNLQKSLFFKSLPQIIDKLPQVCLYLFKLILIIILKNEFKSIKIYREFVCSVSFHVWNKNL